MSKMQNKITKTLIKMKTKNLENKNLFKNVKNESINN